jgi:hypothetical protein
METFKLVVDGIDLTEEDRKRIESGIERAMVEALDGKTKGLVFVPAVHPDGLDRITAHIPNGGWLIRESLLKQEHDQMKNQFKDAHMGQPLRLDEIVGQG